MLSAQLILNAVYKYIAVFKIYCAEFDGRVHRFQNQCPKLRVHPAPGVHISTAGCTILGGVHPVCARFLSHLLLLYIERVHGAISGCTVLWEVHPASAQKKSLISDTENLCTRQVHTLTNSFNIFI